MQDILGATGDSHGACSYHRHLQGHPHPCQSGSGWPPLAREIFFLITIWSPYLRTVVQEVEHPVTVGILTTSISNPIPVRVCLVFVPLRWTIITRIPNPVSILVLLTSVGNGWAVVSIIKPPIPISVWVTCVSNAITVSVLLSRIW